VEQAEPASPADDVFATETMAELCARQGRFGDAVSIYRRLLGGGAVPTDKSARWQARLVELERAPLVAAATRAVPASHPAASSVSSASSVARLSAPRTSSPSISVGRPVAPPAAPPELRLPLLVTQPVRSGQVVYAVKTDLIVIAPVNPGAHLMADGNIHVYGPLRGRAVAGATGCREARIFCRQLEAELVGIDTAYVAREDLPAARIGRPAQIRFQSDAAGDRCVIADLV
jgi:septum site-determining protein MinC